MQLFCKKYFYTNQAINISFDPATWKWIIMFKIKCHEKLIILFITVIFAFGCFWFIQKQKSAINGHIENNSEYIGGAVREVSPNEMKPTNPLSINIFLITKVANYAHTQHVTSFMNANGNYDINLPIGNYCNLSKSMILN